MHKKLIPLLSLLALLAGCAAAEERPPAMDTAEAFLNEHCAAFTEEKLRWSVGECRESEEGSAEADVALTYLDAAAFTAGLREETEAILARRMEEVKYASELCEDGAYRTDALESAWNEALAVRTENTAAYETSRSVTLRLSYGEGGWEILNGGELTVEPLAAALEEAKASLAELVPVRKIYRLAPDATMGPVPDPAGYLVTEDAAEIDALLQRREAQALINGQPTVWASLRERKEGTKLYAYLDETILVLVWQERQVPATLTFAEVFIADASQIIRKLSDDSYGSPTLIVPTEFARETNAVLLTDGDFYQLRGGYGINVYQGRIQQANGELADNCFFDENGNMLFARAGELTTPEAVEQFVAENKIRTGISFGPIMVENGVNVCPDYYFVGDYLGELARCALAQMGELHYLVTTTDYYFSVSNLANLLVERGAQSAYNIDGGQSSAIILMGEQRNASVFPVERAQSDCLFFATALPEK